MRVRFDGGEVLGAAAQLEAAADTAHRLARAAGRLGGDVMDPALADALQVLADVCGDVLEVCGLDLDLVAAKTRAAVVRYGRVEESAARAADRAARLR